MVFCFPRLSAWCLLPDRFLPCRPFAPVLVCAPFWSGSDPCSLVLTLLGACEGSEGGHVISRWEVHRPGER